MDQTTVYPLLAAIHSPLDLRRLEKRQMVDVASEVRRYLIETVSQTGGHLAAGLGTIELTVALHYVFNTPEDRIVWDIGHQAYPHKILTGRREELKRIRKPDGISGFLRRDESVYDTFGAGHSSTSISAALGMATSIQRQNRDEDVVAVIGDGAITAGMAYEALNNAGDMDANVLVILNDNDMSISPNVGALRRYTARLLSGNTYVSAREGSKKVLSTVPPIKVLAKRWEEHMKGMFMPSTLFEELGFYYVGPIDGHDVNALVDTLENMRHIKGPRFLHIVTQKGKGYQPAEGDPLNFHGVSPFDLATGKIEKTTQQKSFTSVFSDWLINTAKTDENLVGITPAMREGSGLVAFSEQFPQRYFDVGIAEQHALTFAAGMACEGQKPVVAIYSTFLQRAYDQLIHDISIQDLDVTLAIDRAGLVGADGATHAGAFDLSFLRCIPNIVILAPADENECYHMLNAAYQHPGCAAVRYPRGAGIGAVVDINGPGVEIGKGEVRHTGNKIAILSFGTMLDEAMKAGEALNATVVNMRSIKPLDTQLLDDIAAAHSLIITVEENVIAGGAGSGVAEYYSTQNNDIRLLHCGLPDHHIEHGDAAQLRAECGLCASGIVDLAKAATP